MEIQNCVSILPNSFDFFFKTKEKENNNRMSKEIYYSDKYFDDEYEYRWVFFFSNNLLRILIIAFFCVWRFTINFFLRQNERIKMCNCVCVSCKIMPLKRYKKRVKLVLHTEYGHFYYKFFLKHFLLIIIVDHWLK